MDEKTRATLREIAIEWDKAEKLMKLAERLRAEVIQPSVNELRYAGRRLVDALNITDEIEGDESKREQFDRFINDCLFRVHCAQHDAIDASVLFVQRAVQEYEAEFGLVLLITHFPAVAELRAAMAEADGVIVSSRQYRGNRAQEYDKLALNHLPTIITVFNTIATNRMSLEALVRDRSTQNRRFHWTNAFIIIAAIIGAILGAFLLNWLSRPH
jgi:hypothetical protein